MTEAPDPIVDGPPVALLGPLELRSPQGTIPLGGEKQRAVLALLLLDHRRSIPASDLIDAVWAESPPPTAGNAIQVYIAGIRKALRETGLDSALTTAGHSYRLDLPDGALDRDAFLAARSRASTAVAQGRRDIASHEYATALAVWRGRALSDLRAVDSVRAQAEHLDELELATFEASAANELALGRAGEMLPSLLLRGARQPLRESLWALIALAQYQAGDQSGALSSLRRIATALREELGVSPGPRLRMLETAVVRHDPGLVVSASEHRSNATAPGDDLVGRIARTVTLPADASSAPRAELVFADDRRTIVAAEPVLLGRAPGCDVVVADPSVSALHARVRSVHGSHVLEDLASTNGTFVNGAAVSRTQLADGDEIGLGRCRLLYRMGSEPSEAD
ncbi:BTAD domain-containing putative transcriptional regulator [Agromyces sp. NPDC049794]|uniref:BTAD domain-containing putative transcriptional regulator n=1 Tax=unclassified Agromyces TaxID=2639701 RepID=UPI0033C66E21